MINADKINNRRLVGFTLVEVLATLLFVAIILPIAMKGISVAATLASDTIHKRQAAMLAEYKMNELLLATSITSGSRGDFGNEHSGYRWESELVHISGGLRQLKVKVAYEHRFRDIEVSLVTLIYDE